jgi:hypothetical protein
MRYRSIRHSSSCSGRAREVKCTARMSTAGAEDVTEADG